MNSSPVRVLVAFLATMGTAGVLLGLSTAPSQAVACPVGAWPYHQAMVGGCGFGRWSKGVDNLGRRWFKLVGTVGDNVGDGSCARVEVKTRVNWAPDSTETYRVCGNGQTTAINFNDLDTSSGLVGSVQKWSVRLCVGGSCTSYVDYDAP